MSFHINFYILHVQIVPHSRHIHLCIVCPLTLECEKITILDAKRQHISIITVNTHIITRISLARHDLIAASVVSEHALR